jgi:hypothetical protein
MNIHHSWSENVYFLIEMEDSFIFSNSHDSCFCTFIIAFEVLVKINLELFISYHFGFGGFLTNLIN